MWARDAKPRRKPKRRSNFDEKSLWSLVFGHTVPYDLIVTLVITKLKMFEAPHLFVRWKRFADSTYMNGATWKTAMTERAKV